MKRLLVFALVASLGNTSLAFAEGALLRSASRAAQQMAQAEAKKPVLAAVQVGQTGLASSGLSKGKKILIALVAGIGFAAAAYTIDQRVVDNTPSSLGTRQD